MVIVQTRYDHVCTIFYGNSYIIPFVKDQACGRNESEASSSWLTPPQFPSLHPILTLSHHVLIGVLGSLGRGEVGVGVGSWSFFVGIGGLGTIGLVRRWWVLLWPGGRISSTRGRRGQYGEGTQGLGPTFSLSHLLRLLHKPTLFQALGQSKKQKHMFVN